MPDHPTLSRRMLQARLKRLAGTSPLLAGSLGLVARPCGTPSCRGHHGGPKHDAYQLTFKERGRSRSVYVPKDLVEEVRQGLAAQRRLDQLLRESWAPTGARARSTTPAITSPGTPPRPGASACAPS